MYLQITAITIIIAAILLTTLQAAIGQQQQIQEQPSLKSIIEKKWTYSPTILIERNHIPVGVKGPGLAHNVTVVYESPKSVILDAYDSDANLLWQAMDIAKDRGYIMDQVMTTGSDPPHFTIFMSHK